MGPEPCTDCEYLDTFTPLFLQNGAETKAPAIIAPDGKSPSDKIPSTISEVRYGITTQIEKSKKNENRKLHEIRFKSTIFNICG